MFSLDYNEDYTQWIKPSTSGFTPNSEYFREYEITKIFKKENEKLVSISLRGK